MEILGLPLTSILMTVFILVSVVVTLTLFAGIFLTGRKQKEKVVKEKNSQGGMFGKVSPRDKKRSIIAKPVKNLSKSEQYNNVFSGAEGVTVQQNETFFSPNTISPVKQNANWGAPQQATVPKPISTPPPAVASSAPSLQAGTPFFASPSPLTSSAGQPVKLPSFGDKNEDAFLEQQAALKQQSWSPSALLSNADTFRPETVEKQAEEKQTEEKPFFTPGSIASTPGTLPPPPNFKLLPPKSS